MLSAADNETLVRVGPGTPMGAVFRRFWIPALLSSELPARDCPPVKVGLLGEKLVAFRDSSGAIGLLDARCPHRLANLYWGRNEDNGLRCVYHGWKFSVTGECLEMPAEPPESKYHENVCATAYATREAGGIIWAYMGPPEKQPPFPAMDWTFFPPEHSVASKRLQRCSYLQNLEGELDSAHNYFLHRFDIPSGQSMMPPAHLRSPRFTVKEKPYGLLIGARRETPTGDHDWRVTPFLMPSFTIIPTEKVHNDPERFTAAVPIDDENMWGFTVTWRPDRPLDATDRVVIASGLWAGHVRSDPKTFIPVSNIDNDYDIDRQRQATDSFTGIPGIRIQDMAVQEDQGGPICDRTIEHLGTSDRAIVATRRLLLRAARELEDGIEPYQAQNAETFRMRAIAMEAPQDQDWEQLVWNGIDPVPSGAAAGDGH